MGGKSGKSDKRAERPERARQNENPKPGSGAPKDNDVEPLDEEALDKVMRETPL
jgi:hypothetical protein